MPNLDYTDGQEVRYTTTLAEIPTNTELTVEMIDRARRALTNGGAVPRRGIEWTDTNRYTEPTPIGLNHKFKELPKRKGIKLLMRYTDVLIYEEDFPNMDEASLALDKLYEYLEDVKVKPVRPRRRVGWQ
jgi:hypothetical protein